MIGLPWRADPADPPSSVWHLLSSGSQLKYASNFIAFAYPSIWVSRLIFLDNGSDFCNPNCDHTEITASAAKRFMIEQRGACRKNK